MQTSKTNPSVESEAVREAVRQNCLLRHKRVNHSVKYPSNHDFIPVDLDFLLLKLVTYITTMAL